MQFLYNISIYFYSIAIKIASLFNHKAKLWVQGRKNIFKTIENTVDRSQKIAWFHCSSLGEFEQGRPIIEKFRLQHPEFKIVLTFFSPSGYEIRKNYNQADYVFYLPIDIKRNAKRFVNAVMPQFCVLIKYEFWFNYINELKQNNIPVYSASTIFRKNQHFFKWNGGWFRKQLKNINYFFVQNQESADLLKSIGFNNIEISGDTRFDRVYSITQNTKSFDNVEKFIQGDMIFIAGSTWKQDEDLLIDLINKKHQGLKFIVVPHEINPKSIEEFRNRIEVKSVLFTDNDTSNYPESNVLIVNTIGHLSQLYQYASIAYIGGGFGKGIHNVLEAATFGMPIIFGPNFHKFQEAKDLINLKGAFFVKNTNELSEFAYSILSNYQVLKFTSEITKNYVINNIGATDKILNTINEHL